MKLLYQGHFTYTQTSPTQAVGLSAVDVQYGLVFTSAEGRHCLSCTVHPDIVRDISSIRRYLSLILVDRIREHNLIAT
jgi:hypothetical protein